MAAKRFSAWGHRGRNANGKLLADPTQRTANGKTKTRTKAEGDKEIREEERGAGEVTPAMPRRKTSV